MDADDPKYLKRKIKCRNIDVHPTLKALVVDYEVEAVVLGERGAAMIREAKEGRKVIQLRNLTDTTNVSSLAEEVLKQCQIIPAIKLPEVEQLLIYLQKRRDDASAKPLAGTMSNPLSAPPDASEEQANINAIDEYLELLYENLDDRLRGSRLILQLARNTDNLDEIFQNEILVGALARVLKDDWKRSIELATNIIFTFFCFSSFSQFHAVISHFKIGALCCTILEAEIGKYEQLVEEVEKRKSAGDKSGELAKSLQRLAQKQDQLLRVTFYLLLNIAEDPGVEMKMCKKDIIKLLTRSLKRNNDDLNLLVLTFLKKLSVFGENVADMFKLNVVKTLAPTLLKSDNAELLMVAARLLYNLSFDARLRDQVVTCGLVPRVCALFADKHFADAVVDLLYHLSMDDRAKSLVAYSDFIPHLMTSLLGSDAAPTANRVVLVPLAINLATNVRCAQLMCDGAGLRRLLKQTFKQKDPLLMKVARNVAYHDDAELRNGFIDFLPHLAKAVVELGAGKDAADEFSLECLGVLNSLIIDDLDYEKIATEYRLVNWIRDHLADSTDDVLLETIILIGTLSYDAECAKMLAARSIIPQLIDCLKSKQEDDEIVAQIIYVFYLYTYHEATRRLVVRDTQAPAYVIDLMNDKNAQIRRICDQTLDIIAEVDAEWSRRIQQEKFRFHNQNWLMMIEQNVAATEPAYDEDYAPHFIDDADMMAKSDMFFGPSALHPADEQVHALAYGGLMMHDAFPPGAGESLGRPDFDHEFAPTPSNYARAVSRMK